MQMSSQLPEAKSLDFWVNNVLCRHRLQWLKRRRSEGKSSWAFQILDSIGELIHLQNYQGLCWAREDKVFELQSGWFHELTDSLAQKTPLPRVIPDHYRIIPYSATIKHYLLIFIMGNEDSSARMAQLSFQYTTTVAKPHLFFGNHWLLVARKNPQDVIICKQFIFESAREER